MKQASKAIGNAVEVLRAEAQRLSAELATLKQTEKGLLAELRRVQAGIQALSSDSGRSQATLSPKPSLADAEVLQMVISLLQDSGTHTQEELRSKLLQHAKAKGVAGTGLHLTLRRVLKDARFAINEEGRVSLSQSDGAV